MKTKNKGVEISVNSILSRDPKQTFSMIDNEVVMLSIEKGEYFALNEVASVIWQFIEEPVSVGDLVNQLINEYKVEYEECLRDTLICLQEFYDKEIIEIQRD